MNKLFKVIWSKSKQCYIVVSEVAKNTTGKKKIAVASVLAALAVSAQVTTVQATVPEGTLTNDAILAIGGNVKANGDSSVVIGKNNEVKNRFSVGIGNNIVTESDNAVAIGSGSNNGKVQALGADSIAMGTRAEATKQSSIAIGRLSKSITDERGVAIGNEAVTTGYAAIAIGDKVNADSKDSISIGRGSKSKAAGAVVVGTGASAEVKNSVALGESSTVTSADAADTTGYLTNDTVNNSEHGVLSIGNGSTITRRILSVASGTNDTDAVNVKQLKALRNATVSTLSVVDGSTTTDVVPTTSVPASVTDANERAKLEKELHKVKLVAGKNITLTANGNAVTIASKSEVNSITSTNADAISITTGTDGTVSVTPNLASDVNADADANKLVTAGKVKAALEQKASASDVNDLKAKLGNISADGRDGQAAGTAGTTAAEKGLTGQDGLNGKSLTDKVNALRNGEAGSVVYTDDQGNRLVKANDGKYYKATQVGADGNKIGDATPIGEDKLQASVMNPDGTKNPTKLSNLKDGKIAENSKDAVTGNQLHKVANGLATALGGGAAVAEDGTITAPTYTVTTADGTGTETASNVGEAITKLDTRITTANGALVTKGLDFYGNKDAADTDKVHRNLGEALKVKGAENFTREANAKNNIDVVKNTAGDGFDVKLAENLGNINSISNATGAGKPGSTITLGADGVSIANTAAGAGGAAGDTKTVTIGKDGINAGKMRITNVATAEADGDVTNKQYVDGAVKALKDKVAKLGDTTADGRDGKAATGKAADDPDATAADKGLTGQDGLNGKSLTDKVNALRNGEAGSVVYTDDQGNRLVKANDGKYYKATQVGADGNKIGDATPIGEDKLQASVMNPDGTKNPTKLSNLKDGKIAENSKDAVTGNQLHKVANGLATALGGGAAVAEDGTITAPTYTVTTADGTGTETASNVGEAITKLDTRITTANGALVTKGLDFYGNKDAADTDKVHRNLGEALKVKGAENFTREANAKNNIDVVKNTAGDGFDVKLAENLGNINSISNATGAGKPGSTITLGADGVSIANTAAGAGGAAGDTKTVTIGKDGINAGKMRITNVATAEADGDVTNKQYVDGAVKALKDKVAKLGDTTADGRDGKAATGKAADDPDATAADKGLTGQDGLNGKSLTDKVNALRNGEAGSVVYTDAQGNRLVKANDGKYYLAKDVGEDGNKVGAAEAVEGDNLKASVMNPDGKGGPTTLSNLKDGKLAAGSKDAVTGNQLYAAKAEVAKYLGGGATVDKDGNVTEPTFTVTNKDGEDVKAHNVGAALSTMNERINSANSAVAADITKLKNMEGLTVAGINKIKELAGQGVNVIGDKNITVKPKNENGVKTFHATLSDDLKLGGTDKEHPNVRVNGTDSTVTAGTGANEVKMNGADGTITAGDGANGKQVKLNGTDGSVQANTVTAGKGDKAVSLDGDKGTITAGTGANAVAVDGTKALITAGTGENQVGINGQDGSVTAKTVKAKDLNANTLTLGNKDSAEAVKMDGTKGTITTGKDGKAIEVNGAEGTITLGKKDGDTKVELNAEKGSVAANIGTFGAPADANGVPTKEGSATSMDKDGFSVTSKDENGNVSKVTIKDGRVSAGNPVDAKGIPTEAGSATSMDKDGFSVATKDEKGNVSKVDIKNGGITAGAPVDAKGIPTETGSATSMDKDNGFSVTSKDKDGNVSKVTIKDGKISGLNGAEYNNYKKDEKGNVVKDKDGNPVVDSSVKMDGAGLIIAPSTGDPKQSVSLTKDGLNNGGNRITNVAPGVEDSDAITVGQVKEVTSKLGAALEKTSQRVDQVGAHSAALAAMNPLSYDPLRKSQIMAGIGSYDGNQALALGVAHYANENFMFNAGITMGSGKSMANIGATYRFGTGDDDNIPERYKGGPISSVYVMQDEITALKAENARKDAENAEMKAQIKMLMERMGMA